MNLKPKIFTVLMANDAAEECFLVQEASREVSKAIQLIFVKDGEELLDYLYCRDRYADPSSAPRPHLILLDLNMPRKDGREALVEIKSDPNLRPIPIVVFTTSKQQRDILYCYGAGANSFVPRPATFEGLVELMKTLYHYWFDIVSLPT